VSTRNGRDEGWSRSTERRSQHPGPHPNRDLGNRSPYPRRLDDAHMSSVLSRALAEGILQSSDCAAVFYDLTHLDSALCALRDSFPSTALHAAAVKANPLIEVLKRIRAAGHGAEVASIGELQLALAAGFAPSDIVFDSPVKTGGELSLALASGVMVSANSLAELARIGHICSVENAAALVSVRINPEVGSGAISGTSVAVRRSKFGVSLLDCRSEIVRAFSEYPWLAGLHVHVGSQGMASDQLLQGVGAVYDLCIESIGVSRLSFFNIGGGLPVKYHESDSPMCFDEYAHSLRKRCPALFTSDIRLVTEFGRSLHAGAGWVASRVEYVQDHPCGSPTVLTHVGADMFLRKAYRPDEWHHDMSVCDSAGHLRRGPPRTFDIAGPLCFAGDFLGRDVALPEDLQEGDYLLIHDAGAYTFGMWSVYNSRFFPAILGYEDEGVSFQHLRRRQTTSELVRFWSRG